MSAVIETWAGRGFPDWNRITGMHLAAGQLLLVLAGLQHLGEDDVLHLHQVGHEGLYFPSFHPYNSTAISLVTNADLSGKKYNFTLLEGKSITCNVPVP